MLQEESKGKFREIPTKGIFTPNLFLMNLNSSLINIKSSSQNGHRELSLSGSASVKVTLSNGYCL